MAERYPGYDVLAKRRHRRGTTQTRRVVDQRLALLARAAFLTADELADAGCDRRAHRAAAGDIARRSRSRRWSIDKLCLTTRATAIAMPTCRR